MTSIDQQLTQADRAAFLDKMLRQNLLVERLAKKTQDGTVGQPTEEPADQRLASGDGMAVSVGNTTTHNYAAPSATFATSTLAKLAMGAALLAGGTGLGAGAMALIDALKSKPAAITSGADANTEYQLNLLPEETAK